MKTPRSKSKPEPKPNRRIQISHELVHSLIKASLELDECAYILVLSLATVLANCDDVRTVQDVVDHWREVAEGSESTVRTVAGNIIDQVCQRGEHQ